MSTHPDHTNPGRLTSQNRRPLKRTLSSSNRPTSSTASSQSGETYDQVDENGFYDTDSSASLPDEGDYNFDSDDKENIVPSNVKRISEKSKSTSLRSVEAIETYKEPLEASPPLPKFYDGDDKIQVNKTAITPRPRPPPRPAVHSIVCPAYPSAVPSTSNSSYPRIASRSSNVFPVVRFSQPASTFAYYVGNAPPAPNPSSSVRQIQPNSEVNDEIQVIKTVTAPRPRVDVITVCQVYPPAMPSTSTSSNAIIAPHARRSPAILTASSHAGCAPTAALVPSANSAFVRYVPPSSKESPVVLPQAISNASSVVYHPPPTHVLSTYNSSSVRYPPPAHVPSTSNSSNAGYPPPALVPSTSSSAFVRYVPRSSNLSSSVKHDSNDKIQVIKTVTAPRPRADVLPTTMGRVYPPAMPSTSNSSYVYIIAPQPSNVSSLVRLQQPISNASSVVYHPPPTHHVPSTSNSSSVRYPPLAPVSSTSSSTFVRYVPQPSNVSSSVRLPPAISNASSHVRYVPPAPNPSSFAQVSSRNTATASLLPSNILNACHRGGRPMDVRHSFWFSECTTERPRLHILSLDGKSECIFAANNQRFNGHFIFHCIYDPQPCCYIKIVQGENKQHVFYQFGTHRNNCYRKPCPPRNADIVRFDEDKMMIFVRAKVVILSPCYTILTVPWGAISFEFKMINPERGFYEAMCGCPAKAIASKDAGWVNYTHAETCETWKLAQIDPYKPKDDDS